MKAAILLLATAGLGVGAAVGQFGGPAGHKAPKKHPSVETYEHLATAIIALRQTEDGLVKGILTHYRIAAQHGLRAAAKADGADRKKALEAAATQITNIAKEGDKPIQAIKQRLSKAGHHHMTDTDTKEDYILIDSKEKKAFLSLAQKVAKMGGDTPVSDIEKAQGDLEAMFTKAIAAE